MYPTSMDRSLFRDQKAMEILRKLTTEENIPKEILSCSIWRRSCRNAIIVSKTGYTGEDGVEIYTWQVMLEKRCGRHFLKQEKKRD